MARPLGIILFNALVPGAGLVLCDRILSGLATMVLALAVAGAALLAGLIASEGFAPQVRSVAVLAYAGLSLMTCLYLLWSGRTPRIDRERVRALHDRAAKAYLLGDGTEALATARALARAAPSLAGSWILLGMASRQAGSRRWERRAARRLRRLERLDSDA